MLTEFTNLNSTNRYVLFISVQNFINKKRTNVQNGDLLMNNEKEITITSEETSIPLNGNETDYIAEIQKLKANTVSLDDYNRLKADNKKLINALASGETIGSTEPSNPEKNINELRNKLLKDGSNLNNLEYVQTAVELRDLLIAQGQRDPFLPYGEGVLPTAEDVECANRVANIYKECIEYADGDPDIFTSELQRRTVDAGPIKRK